MTPERSATPPSTALTVIALKVVGVITILAFLLDFFVITLPPNASDRTWLLAVMSQLVERGIVPLVGIALLLVGTWIQNANSPMPRRPPIWANLRLWALILSAFLGLVYLLFTVLYPNTIRANSQQTLAQIEQRATEAQAQLEGQIGQQVQQQRAQIDVLLQNEELLAQAVESGQIPQEQADLLRQFREDPNALNQFIEQQVGSTREELQTRLGTEREDAESRVRQETLKSGIRISLSSLLLAIGYFVIAAFGFGALRAGA